MKKPDTIETYFANEDVHDTRFVAAGGGIALFASILLLVLHGYNAWLYFFAQSISFGTAFIFHAALSLAAGLAASAFSGVDRESRFFILLFISTATTGVFGAGGTLVAILLHMWYMRYAQPFSAWFSSIFPSPETNESQQIYDNIQMGRDESSKPYSVIPFNDVIWYGSEAQKRMALSKMTSRFDPSFAPAFKKALNDSSNSIRVQAATAISKIENQFMAQLMKLNQLHSEQPRNPTVTLAIAGHYDDYAFTGILDDDRERHNRAQALKYYQQYIEMRPTDTEAHIKIGRLLMRNGDYLRALEWLSKSMERGHTTPSLLAWYAEALFACRRYSELRQLARDGKLNSIAEGASPALLDAIEAWKNTTTVTEVTLEKGYA